MKQRGVQRLHAWQSKQTLPAQNKLSCSQLYGESHPQDINTSQSRRVFGPSAPIAQEMQDRFNFRYVLACCAMSLGPIPLLWCHRSHVQQRRMDHAHSFAD